MTAAPKSPTVTREDREAAAKWTRSRCRGLGMSEAQVGAIAETISKGDADDDDLVQAFAAHRLAASTPGADSGALRAALVAARGWVVTCSESATARRDLKVIDAALAATPPATVEQNDHSHATPPETDNPARETITAVERGEVAREEIEAIARKVEAALCEDGERSPGSIWATERGPGQMVLAVRTVLSALSRDGGVRG